MISLIYVQYLTSRHKICAGRRPLPLIIPYRTARKGPDNSTFLGLHIMSPRRGETTDRGRLVCRLNTAVFGNAPSQLVGTLAPCNAPTPIPIGRYANAKTCTESAKYVSVRCHTCRPCPPNQLQIHATTLGRTGHTNYGS